MIEGGREIEGTEGGGGERLRELREGGERLRKLREGGREIEGTEEGRKKKLVGA